MNHMFDGELGLMISALLVFAGMTDFIIITLFLGKKHPHTRNSDGALITPVQKELIKQRVKRYKMTQFGLAMSGLLLIIAGLYGISVQIMKAI